MQLRPYLTIFLFFLPVFAVSVADSFICIPLSGAANLNTTIPDKLPRTPCYLSKSNLYVVFTETSYPLAFRAIRSIFQLVGTDIKAHTQDEIISSSNLWYPGDYPYNNTELFVRMTQADLAMTWGEWKNASLILAYFYTRFSTVGLDFEIKMAESGRSESLAKGRISLYDQVETGTGTE